MTRPVLLLLAAAALAACRGSDPQPLELIASDAFDGQSSSIQGGGTSAYVAYSRYDMFTASWFVRIVRHPAARPDELEVVAQAETETGFEAPCLFVSDDRAVFCSATGLAVLDLADPLRPATPIAYGALQGVPESLAVAGRWLLAASGSTLALVDLDQPAAGHAFTTPAPVTAVIATAAGSFLAFTTTGYVHVAPAPTSPAFDAVADPVVRNFRGAFANGVEAMVAGPSATLGTSRIVRLDIGAPLTPKVLASHEVDGEYGFFAWDGASTSVLAIGPAPVHQGWVVRDDGAGFSTEGIPLPYTWRSANPIAAHADRLFVVAYPGFGFFRIR